MTKGTDWLDRQWQDFLNPTANASKGVGAARLVSARVRAATCRVAIDGFEANPLAWLVEARAPSRSATSASATST